RRRGGSRRGPRRWGRVSRSDRKRLKAAQVEVLPVPRWRPVQAQGGRTLEQCLEDEPALQPGQRRSQTKMRSEAERHVLVVLPATAQPVRVGELSRIAIGRPRGSTTV